MPDPWLPELENTWKLLIGIQHWQLSAKHVQRCSNATTAVASNHQRLPRAVVGRRVGRIPTRQNQCRGRSRRRQRSFDARVPGIFGDARRGLSLGRWSFAGFLGDLSRVKPLHLFVICTITAGVFTAVIGYAIFCLRLAGLLRSFLALAASNTRCCKSLCPITTLYMLIRVAVV